MPHIIDFLQIHLRKYSEADLKGARGAMTLQSQLPALIMEEAPNVKVKSVLIQELLVQ